MDNFQNNNNTSIYSDAVDLSFNYDNFNLNFLSKEDGQFMFLGRVKLSPQTTKALLKTMQENIKKYESIYGKINVFDDKAREKENQARQEVMINRNEKLDAEIERLEALQEEKIKRIKMLEDELAKDTTF